MEGNIYCIENILNNKKYIGKTMLDIDSRFNRHIISSRQEINKDRPLYRAFKKYGIDNFKITLIEKCEEDKINEREIYWINFYDTYNKGYNATLGGDGNTLYDYEEICILAKQGLSTSQISQIIGCCQDRVRVILKSKNIKWETDLGNGGKLVSKSQQKFIENSKAVTQFDLNNNKINDFPSFHEAARWLVLNTKCKKVQNGVCGINDCIKGKQKTAYGYIWRLNNGI